MRVVLLLGLTLVAVASASVNVAQNYHKIVGIPLAAKIKEHEASLSNYQQRIVGGALAPVNAHPYFAGLLIDLINVPNQSVCGSSVLSVNRLVTAAHCWRDRRNQAWRFTVILGTNFLYSGGTRVPTTQVITHPQWNVQTLNNDIAMIYLPTNVWFSASIQPIALPSNFELWESFVGHWPTAAGFGRTNDAQQGASTVVSNVNVQVISVDECRRTYGSVHIQTTNICTSGLGGVGICGGDSGGPLSIFFNGRRILIGISSFVADTGCQLGHPSAYARVTSFRNFIDQHM